MANPLPLSRALYPSGQWPASMHAALFHNRKRRRLLDINKLIKPGDLTDSAWAVRNSATVLSRQTLTLAADLVSAVFQDLSGVVVPNATYVLSGVFRLAGSSGSPYSFRLGYEDATAGLSTADVPLIAQGLVGFTPLQLKFTVQNLTGAEIQLRSNDGTLTSTIEVSQLLMKRIN